MGIMSGQGGRCDCRKGSCRPGLGGREGRGATRGGAGPAREAGHPWGPCRASGHPLPVRGQAVWDPEIKPALQSPSGSLCSWGLREHPGLGEPETDVSTWGWGKSSAALQGPGHRPPSLESWRLGKDLLTTKWAQELLLSFLEDSRSPPSPLVRPVRGQGKKTRAVRVLPDTRALGEETWGPEGSLPTSPQGPSRGLCQQLSAHSQAAGRGSLGPPVPLLPREALLGHTPPQEESQSRLVPRGPRVALG